LSFAIFPLKFTDDAALTMLFYHFLPWLEFSFSRCLASTLARAPSLSMPSSILSLSPFRPVCLSAILPLSLPVSLFLPLKSAYFFAELKDLRKKYADLQTENAALKSQLEKALADLKEQKFCLADRKCRAHAFSLPLSISG
jgi:hypothetical protein